MLKKFDRFSDYVAENMPSIPMVFYDFALKNVPR